MDNDANRGEAVGSKASALAEPTQREVGLWRRVNGHASWLAPAAISASYAMFIAVRVLGASNGNMDTAAVLLQQMSPIAVLGRAGLDFLPVATLGAAYMVWYLWRPRRRPLPNGRLVRASALIIGLLAAVLVPLLVLLAYALAVLVMSWVTRRFNRLSIRAGRALRLDALIDSIIFREELDALDRAGRGHRLGKYSRAGTRRVLARAADDMSDVEREARLMRVRVALPVATLLLSAMSGMFFDDRVWMPREAIFFTDRPTLIGYWVGVDASGWSTLLIDGDRKVVHIRDSEVVSRQLCAVPQPWFRRLFLPVAWAVRSEGPAYPQCP